VPTAPLVGLKLEITGVGTVKFVALFPVIPLTVTEIGPVVAPTGTVVVMLVVVELNTVARTPLNRTVLLAAVLLKLVPEIVTDTPYTPLPGLNPEMDGVPKTVKFEALLIVTPLEVIEMGPVPAPAGTAVVILVEFDELTTAGMLLNVTIGESKFVPVIVTMVPVIPPVGLKPVTVGVGDTTKLLLLRTVTPLTATDIFPKVAPAGTVVVMLVAVEAVTTAVVLLNFTM
jgi:hypothetical protein